jgi:hypothetical protein
MLGIEGIYVFIELIYLLFFNYFIVSLFHCFIEFKDKDKEVNDKNRDDDNNIDKDDGEDDNILNMRKVRIPQYIKNCCKETPRYLYDFEFDENSSVINESVDTKKGMFIFFIS